MSTHKPHPDQEHLQEIKEALEEKPDRNDLENWSSDLAFKLEELHEDVRELQGELSEVKSQIEDLQSEDR
jgi:uncharacterized coiled-coil DUF342 family protein